MHWQRMAQIHIVLHSIVAGILFSLVQFGTQAQQPLNLATLSFPLLYLIIAIRGLIGPMQRMDGPEKTTPTLHTAMATFLVVSFIASWLISQPLLMVLPVLLHIAVEQKYGRQYTGSGPMKALGAIVLGPLIGYGIATALSLPTAYSQHMGATEMREMLDLGPGNDPSNLPGQ